MSKVPPLSRVSRDHGITESVTVHVLTVTYLRNYLLRAYFMVGELSPPTGGHKNDFVDKGKSEVRERRSGTRSTHRTQGVMTPLLGAVVLRPCVRVT